MKSQYILVLTNYTIESVSCQCIVYIIYTLCVIKNRSTFDVERLETFYNLQSCLFLPSQGIVIKAKGKAVKGGSREYRPRSQGWSA